MANAQSLQTTPLPFWQNSAWTLQLIHILLQEIHTCLHCIIDLVVQVPLSLWRCKRCIHACIKTFCVFLSCSNLYTHTRAHFCQKDWPGPRSCFQRVLSCRDNWEARLIALEAELARTQGMMTAAQESCSVSEEQLSSERLALKQLQQQHREACSSRCVPGMRF